MFIVGLGHRKRVGKDTAARFLLSILREHPKYRGKNVGRRGFADPLYDVAYKLYSWAGFQRREYYEEHPAAKEAILPLLGRTPRKILIDIGIKMREQDENVWVNSALRSNPIDVLVVPDVRFPNELDAIQKLGGAVVKINKPDVPHTDDAADSPLATADRWDHTIQNDGTMNELHSKCHHLLRILELI